MGYLNDISNMTHEQLLQNPNIAWPGGTPPWIFNESGGGSRPLSFAPLPKPHMGMPMGNNMKNQQTGSTPTPQPGGTAPVSQPWKSFAQPPVLKTPPQPMMASQGMNPGFAGYARGGSVQGLKHAAQHVRNQGEDDDTILAHINPEEAHFLKHHFGGDVNPHTGLPQFGFFRKLEKMLRPITKTVLPIAGSVIGGMFGGPAGSMMGGALGGGLSSKSHRLDHALGGSLVGLGNSIISPMLGQHFGLNPDSMLGKASMMNAPTWGEQLGMSSAAAKAAPAVSKAAERIALKEGLKAAGNGGFLGSLGIKDALDAGLMATMIGGTLGAKSKRPKEEKSLQEMMSENSGAMHNNPRNAYRTPKKRYRKVIQPPNEYNPRTHPEWNYFEEQEVPALAKSGRVKSKKIQGKAIDGYIDGHSGGQTDDVKATIPEGAYVMDATTVSLLGDGNSHHGAAKIKKFEDKFLRSGITKDLRPSRNIKAKISDGEYVLSKHMVTNLGNGDNRKGSKILDNMRNNLRKQKGVKKFLPPKSKDIMHYVR